MLLNLQINNFLLIDKLDIEFKPGLCVITGETGAGKSILLDALLAALGEKSSNKLVRAGQDTASVTAEFVIDHNEPVRSLLSDLSVDFDDKLILRRIINSDGRSRILINGVAATNSIVKKLTSLLIEIHGQNDQAGLIAPENHQAFLDQYAMIHSELRELQISYLNWQDAVRELEQLQNKQNSIIREEDYLSFVVTELEKLSPQMGEEIELSNQRTHLMSHEKMVDALNAALSEFNKYDLSKLYNSVFKIFSRINLNNDFKQILDTLDRANIEYHESLSLLSEKLQYINNSSDDLEEIENRLFAIRNAARKYNVPSNELPAFLHEMKERLFLIRNIEHNLSNLAKKVEQLKEVYYQKAEFLSKIRKEAAKRLEIAALQELSGLKMDKAKFKIIFEPLKENQWNQNGIERIYFVANTNPGLDFAPIQKIASGGELSRFMLALKTALSKVKSVDSLIFDEIDVGIGGAVADAVGKKLAQLGQNYQVIVITHQAQIAAKGNLHLHAVKKHIGECTETTIAALSVAERKEEIARMLAGEVITDEARKAAEKLLEQ